MKVVLTLALTVAGLCFSATSAVAAITWQIMPQADLPPGTLHGVAASGPHDVWAVGAVGASPVSDALILHWNGKHWKPVPAPGGSDALYAVAAISPSDAWAAGWNRTLLHWDGHRWTALAGARGNLLALSGSAASPLWAGGSARGNAQLLQTFAGSGWSGNRIPKRLRLMDAGIGGVAAPSPDAVFAVGAYATGHNEDVVFDYWNGRVWRDAAITGDTTWSDAALNAVSAFSGTDAWSVGHYSDVDVEARSSLAVHWNGSSFTAYKLRAWPTDHSLNGVVTLGPADAWAVGERTSGTGTGPAAARTLIMHWTGTAWDDLGGPNVSGVGNSLAAVAAIPGTASNLWAVGSAGDRPLILHAR